MNPFNSLFALPITFSLYTITAWGRIVGDALSTGPQRESVDLSPPRVSQAQRDLATDIPPDWKRKR